METTIKLLCTEQEAKALLELVPPTRFIQMVKNDPTWGFDGSGDFYVVYIDNSHGYYTPSILFRLGVDLGKKIAKN
jgi:hypothetical protein